VSKNQMVREHAAAAPARSSMQESLLKLLVGALVLVTAWSYWPTMVSLFKDWRRDEDYSAGQLVPLIALYLLWRRRKALAECLLRPCWWGLGLIALAQAGRFYGLMFMFESAERYSIVLTIAGLVLMVAGRDIFRSVSWILLFLFLMVPFPGKIHNLISGPLQKTATTGAVFLLEAFGARVSQQGNVLTLNENTPMAVAEACSGLRMLTAFIIVAAFMAFMVKRSGRQKAVLLLSSVPVAVMCNIIRLLITGGLFIYASTEVAEKFFHDFAGLAMMPMAVGLIFGQLWLMDKLVVPDQSQAVAPQVIARARPAGQACHNPGAGEGPDA